MTQASDFQLPSDPVRAAAESVEGLIEEQLYQAWSEASSNWRPPFGLDKDLSRAKEFVLRSYRRGLTTMWDQIGPMDLDPIRKDGSELEARYDRVAPGTFAAAQDFAAQWVREITEETRQTINQKIQEGVAKGLPAPKIAQTVKESIGLTDAQARAVANYRRMLEANSAGALNYRLRDPSSDDEVERAIISLKPLKPAQIDKQVEAYYQRYLRFRARTIARFESLFASNSGAASAITQAVAQGVLPANTHKRWLVAHDERLCPKCRSIPEIAPEGVTLSQPFEWREGKKSGTIMIPPLHPRCRCTITYRVLR